MSEKKGLFGGLFGGKENSGCCDMETVPEDEGCCCDGDTAENGCCCESEFDPGDGMKAEASITIKILGTGCKKCHGLEENVKEAVKDMNGRFDVIMISDIDEIVSYGVMKTPTLVVGNKIVSVGKLLKPEEVKAILLKTLS